ncbi:CU044_2847 family protein [Streptomyces sp. NPDC048417]|uniref:CU044_2847 family protein n=1 Tax=unclassified Streptomyces TaxID=2593676 RepID=UPI00342D6E6B
MARIPLEDGGCVLVEASSTVEGPVKAGRVGEVVHDLPGSLQEALGPITAAARAAAVALRSAGPHELAVEFGVDLAVEAGAVITRAGAHAHLHVTVRWANDLPASGDDGKLG